ncbi:MAG: ATP-grasp domain-containing protein, partial [Candidatus Bathyarchaeia archaeon]
MVRLYEYQGKQLLQEVGISAPEGAVASTPREAEEIAEKLGRPVAIKSQVLSTGRGKAGGIKFADSPEEARKAAEELIGSEIRGSVVEKVLVEEKLDIEREFYAGVIVDDSYKVKAPVVIFSTMGGVDIEEVARNSPEKIARTTVDIFRGLRIYDAYNLLRSLKVESKLLRPLGRTMAAVSEMFRRYDARALEINPLALMRDGEVVAADCRLTVDDSSVPRHPELGIKVARDSDKPLTELERIAWTIEEGDYRGISFFAQLAPEGGGEGYIGYHGIGGGGAILGVDALTRQGLKIANYADTSGNPTASKVYRIVRTILSQRGIEGYILAGFCVANQEQWHHAHGVVKALREELVDKEGFPVVLVLAGNKEEESMQILKEGLEDLPIRLEIYGRDHVYDTDFVAKRMKELVDEY